jgi:hypothetical protein
MRSFMVCADLIVFRLSNMEGKIGEACGMHGRDMHVGV